MRILCFGDSITQGLWGIEGGWVERVRRHFDTLSVKDLSHVQPEIFNLGISGDTTRSLLGRITSETSARTWKQDPVVVVIAIGTNDGLFEDGEQWIGPEEFHGNLERIIVSLKPVVSGIMLVGNPACDESRTMPVSWGDFTYANRELERCEKTIAEIAGRHGLTYVPLFAGFKRKLEAGEDLLADGLHPNDAGHQYIADRVLLELASLLQKIKS
jgi:lysophospholipase L1-like esterase